MRVLMLAQFYPPVPGGAEIHVGNLAQGLANRGHQLEVVTLAQDADGEDVMEGAVRVHRLRGLFSRIPGLHSPDLPRAAAPLPDPAIVRALARIVRRLRPDVVHGHNWLLHSYLPLAPFSTAPVVESLHNYGLVCAKQSLMRNGAICTGPGLEKCLRCAGRHYGPGRGIVTAAALWASRAFERPAVSRFLPVTEAVALGNQLGESGLPYTVVPNFVPDNVAEPGPDALWAAGQLPPGPFLLYVGAVARVKGVQVLFDAYRRLPDAPPLVIIGFRGAEMDELLATTPPNVTVHLDWPHDAVMEAWRRCAVGVCPSIWAEPCPTVVIEAMAAGVPMIGSSVGGIPELLGDGDAGLLVPANDAVRLADALRRLIVDDELRTRLSGAARSRAQRYMSSRVIPQVEEIYRAVIEAGATAHRQGSEGARP